MIRPDCQLIRGDWVQRDGPLTVECETLQALAEPPNTTKLLLRWRDGQRTPDVRVLV